MTTSQFVKGLADSAADTSPEDLASTLAETWAEIVAENESQIDLVTTDQARQWRAFRDRFDRDLDQAVTNGDTGSLHDLARRLGSHRHQSGESLSGAAPDQARPTSEQARSVFSDQGSGRRRNGAKPSLFARFLMAILRPFGGRR